MMNRKKLQKIMNDDGWKYFAFMLVMSVIAIHFIIKTANLRSIWYDDIVEINNVYHGLSIKQMLTRIRTMDNTPLLSYIVTAIWLRIAPYGDSWIKLPNIIFTICGCALCAKVVYNYTDHIIGAWITFFAGLTSRGIITFAAYTVRPYGLLIFVMSLVIDAYTMMHYRSRRGIGVYVYYTISLILALHTHYFCVLTIASLFIVDLYRLIKEKSKDFLAFVPYVLSGLTFLPWVLYVFRTTYERTRSHATDVPTIDGIVDMQNLLFGTDILLWMFGLAVIFICAKKILALQDEYEINVGKWKELPGVLLWMMFFTYGMVWIYSSFNQNGTIFIFRYMLSLAPASFILVGMTAEKLRRYIDPWKKGRLAVVSCVVALSLFLMLDNFEYVEAEQKTINEPYREVAEWCMSQPDIYDDNVAILVATANRADGWAYYLTQNGQRPMKMPIFKEDFKSLRTLDGINKLYVVHPFSAELTPKQLEILQNNFTMTYINEGIHLAVWER